jgi:hypothetical protein
MKRFNELYKRLEKLNINKMLQEAIVDVAPKIKEYNQQQLTDGLLTNSQNIGEYNTNYAAWRRSNGLQIAHVDLKVTGALYRAIRVEVSTTTTTVSSKVSYTSKLQGKYETSGGYIFGLTDKNLNEISKLYIVPKMFIEVRKELFK